MSRWLPRAILPVVLTLVSLGCGSSGDDDEFNLTGSWQLTANLTNDPCGASTANPELRTLVASVTVQQIGSQIVLKDVDGNQFTGTLSGSTVTFTGTRTEPDSDCIFFTLTFTGNGTASDTRIHGTLDLTLQAQAAACMSQNCTLRY